MLQYFILYFYVWNIKMLFFKSGFYKSLLLDLVVIVVSLCSSVAFSQSETNGVLNVVQIVDKQTNSNAVVQVANATVSGGENVAIVDDKSSLKKIVVANETKLAIAAIVDGVYPTANKIAREQLQKCDDFSTIDAELLFHVVMQSNLVNLLGAQECLKRLDSANAFGSLWGSKDKMSVPESLINAALFWKACCLADLNKKEEAITILRGLITENKFNYDFLKVEVYRRLCYELVLTGKLEEAAIYYSTKSLPPVTDPLCGEAVVLFRLAQAKVLFQLSKAKEAEPMLKNLINELGSNSNASLKAIALLLNMELLIVDDRHSSAIELFGNSVNKEAIDNASPRVKALLLCKYAQALAIVIGSSENSAITKQNAVFTTIDEAIKTASKAVESIYSSEERMICLETLILVLATTENFDEVKNRIMKLLEYAPNSSFVARILRNVAQCYQENENYEHAYWAYQLYLHSFTDSIHDYSVMIDAGDCLIHLDRYDEAALQFKRASEFAIDAGRKNLANYKAGEAYFQSKRFLQAAECFAALQLGVPAQEELLISGQLYHAKAVEKFDLPTAKLLYKQLLKSEAIELKEPALIAIAALCVSDGELTQALDYYVNLIALSSEKPRDSYALALLGRGLVELKIGQYNEALKNFEQAQAVENGGESSIRAAFFKTEALYMLGHDQMAYSNAVTFLERFPNSPLVIEADFWLAKYDFNKHRYAQAEQRFLEFDKKWEKSIHAPIAHLLAIYAMMKQEKYAEVVSHTAEWTNTHGDVALLGEVQYLSGEARSKLLQFDLAAHSYAQAAKNAHSEGLKHRAMMRQADCIYTLGADNAARYDEAIQIYKELLLMSNHHQGVMIQLAYKLAKCYEKQNLFDLAIEYYYDNIILQVEASAREADNTKLENYLKAIGGAVWYARAIVDVAAIYEKQGTPEALNNAEALLGRLVGTSLPCADEARMSLERIHSVNAKQFILK